MEEEKKIVIIAYILFDCNKNNLGGGLTIERQQDAQKAEILLFVLLDGNPAPVH